MLLQPPGFELLKNYYLYIIIIILIIYVLFFAVHDAGRTQIEAGSLTVLALGPECPQTLDTFVLGLEEIK